MDSLWAITKLVRPFSSASIPSCTSSSVWVSMLEVASSRIRIFGIETIVRAKAISCLWPIESPKTANVIRGNVYNEPSVVVDTHVKRISRRLGLTKEEDPVKVEYDLMKALPKDHWILYNIQIITLGRSICTARNPKCSECFLSDLCKAEDKKN